MAVNDILPTKSLPNHCKGKAFRQVVYGFNPEISAA
jgi:hypothetical protein